MRNSKPFAIAAALALTMALPAAALAQVGAAPAATVADPQAQAFIETLSAQAFTILRDPSVDRQEARSRFRAMLKQNVALVEIGNRLIRRQRAQITPAQYQAYVAALPEFVLNAYAERLYNYADAKVTTQRLIARGPFTDVVTRVTKPGGQALDAIWQVRKTPEGKYLINGLTVGGINLSLTQEADFAAYIQKNGFDALVEFMKNANAKSVRTPI